MKNMPTLCRHHQNNLSKIIFYFVQINSFYVPTQKKRRRGINLKMHLITGASPRENLSRRTKLKNDLKNDPLFPVKVITWLASSSTRKHVKIWEDKHRPANFEPSTPENFFDFTNIYVCGNVGLKKVESGKGRMVRTLCDTPPTMLRRTSIPNRMQKRKETFDIFFWQNPQHHV